MFLAVVIAAFLAFLFVDFANGYGRLRWLGEVSGADYPGAPWPSLSIVAPARNEARGIEAAIQTLLRLDYPGLEIIVINDRSTDDTGAILERLVRENEWARLKHAEIRLKHASLRDVQTGPDAVVDATYVGANDAAHRRQHHRAARAAGSARTTPCTSAPRAPRAISCSSPTRTSSSSRRRCGARWRIWKRSASITSPRCPTCVSRALRSTRSSRRSASSSPCIRGRGRRGTRSSGAHVGIGAFNLIRAEVYRAIGGHKPIAMRPDDDMKLGKLVKKRGFRQDAVIGRNFVIVEWYTSLRELIDGLMKNAFAGVEYNLWAVAGSTAGLLVTNVWPFIAVFVTTGATQWLYLASVLLLILVFLIVNNTRMGYVIAYPAAALLFTYIMWRSALRAVSRGTIAWRGTEYSLAEMRKNRALTGARGSSRGWGPSRTGAGARVGAGAGVGGSDSTLQS